MNFANLYDFFLTTFVQHFEYLEIKTTQTVRIIPLVVPRGK